MQIYLVGGAIRDRLLGLPAPFERDWVVVGSTAEEMQSKGFIKVGKSFPVYVDPKTSEEFALARTEKKSGHGYHGFNFNADSEISLEDDLMRRDLTINAIAEDENGNLIDPFNGVEDLNNRILRHVSDAFIDDPLRVLRVARFFAKLSKYEFTIAPETNDLIRDIINSGELNYLVPERVWLETEKALKTECFEIYFQTLFDLNAINDIYPDLKDIDQAIYDPYTYPLIRYRNTSPEMKMASIFCALDDLQLREVKIIEQLDEIQGRIKFPNSFKLFAKNTLRFSKHMQGHIGVNDIYKILQGTDAFRNPEYFYLMMEFYSLADTEESGDGFKLSVEIVIEAFDSCKDIRYNKDLFKGLKGDAIKDKLDALRIEKIISITNY
jgi:tRNA nucleotidyltransferase (CCA-adding enzyme)